MHGQKHIKLCVGLLHNFRIFLNARIWDI